MLVPPDNFAMVEDGLYRCSRLDPINHPFLDTLKLKSIVWLDEEKPPRLVSNYIDCHNLRLFHLKTLPEEDDNIANVKFQEWMVLKPVIVSKIFQFILDYKNNHNCLLVDSSEVVVGILRHIQRWSYSSISNEYRLYSNYKANYSVENYLELIDIELIPYETIHGFSEEDDEFEDSNDNEDELLQIDEEALTSADESTNPIESQSPTSSSRKEKEEELSTHTTRTAISIDVPNSSTTTFNNNSNSLFQSSYNNSNNNSYNSSSFTNRRRISFARSTSPRNNSFSSSSKLSMSTSPQIPHQLLKLVELRKQKKKHREQQQQELNEVSKHRHHHHHPTKHNKKHSMSESSDGGLKSLLGKSNKDTRSESIVSKTSITSVSSCTLPQYAFYQAKTDFRLINDKKKEINTTIKIKLPKEENLPSWFTEQRDLWEEECRYL